MVPKGITLRLTGLCYVDRISSSLKYVSTSDHLRARAHSEGLGCRREAERGSGWETWAIARAAGMSSPPRPARNPRGVAASGGRQAGRHHASRKAAEMDNDAREIKSSI